MAVLPVQASTFVGRQDDVGELGRLIASSRMVTLCGTGGIGKTRLALQVADASMDVFGDGVWLVELAELDTGAPLPERVAASLRVEVGGDATDAVAGALGTGRQLLVLDNCEHVIDDAAELAGKLLRACPDLTILATSREPLRVQGEVLWRVPPLSLDLVRGRSDAELLFSVRARAAAPERAIPDEETVRGLCADLEGIPLAIELAAAMTRVLSVDQIRARLFDRFKLLSSGPRTAPARQRTLLATIEWSYEMLGADAQSVLRQLTVFRTAWTLEIAEMSCEGVGDVLEALAELIDKSLIMADGEVSGQARYRMLDTVRDYARQKVAELGGERELRDRHLRCVAELAVLGNEMIEALTPENQRDAIGFWTVLDMMQPNVLTAMHHAADSGQAVTGLRLFQPLQWAILGTGVYEEYAAAADRLCAAATDAPPALIGQVKALRGAMCLYSGDVTGALAFTTEALALCEEGDAGLILASIGAAALGLPGGLPLDGLLDLAPDRQTRIGVLSARAMIAQVHGHPREAAGLYAEMRAVFDGAHHWVEELALLGLAQLAHDRGDLPAALAHYEAALAILDSPEFPLECRNERIRTLSGLARLALETGDYATAEARVRRALDCTRDLGVRSHAADLAETAALIASRENEHGRAVLLASAVDALRERLGNPSPAARTQEILDPATRALGRHEVTRLWSEGHELPWNRVLSFLTCDIPLSAPPVAPGESRPPTVLTEREREVAHLVARGLSNRRIADDLVISPATVARHVTNILTKLGFSSRAQIATWITSRGDHP